VYGTGGEIAAVCLCLVCEYGSVLFSKLHTFQLVMEGGLIIGHGLYYRHGTGLWSMD